MDDFRTGDIGLAVALLSSPALRVEFPRIEPNGGRCLFVFPVSEEAVQPLVESYYNRALQVDARTFEQNRRDLTSRMYLAKEAHGR